MRGFFGDIFLIVGCKRLRSFKKSVTKWKKKLCWSEKNALMNKQKLIDKEKKAEEKL